MYLCKINHIRHHQDIRGDGFISILLLQKFSLFLGIMLYLTVLLAAKSQ